MNEHIQLMIDWIEENLKNEFSLDKLSNYMGYSPYYCSFKFHQVTGNGTKPANSPLYKATGQKNLNAYQEKVLAILEQYRFLNDTKLGQFPFSTADFKYDPNTSKNIVFKRKEYTLTDRHPSIYHFKTGNQVLVTRDGVNVRSKPTSASSGQLLSKNTNLIIQGGFVYDGSVNSSNQFVWYPVKTADQKLVGYISSAYIMKKGAPLAPAVNAVTDKDMVVTGTTAPNSIISVKSGSTFIGKGKADSQGVFSIAISVQKAGTKISVMVRDSAGNSSFQLRYQYKKLRLLRYFVVR